MNLTSHFTFEEMTDSVSHPKLVAQNRIDAQKIMPALQCTANGIEAIRIIINAPLNCSSGFRNPALNTAVEGSETSGHLKGRCADISTPAMDYQALFNTIKSHKIPNLYKCIGEGVKGKQWVHCEFRDGYTGEVQYYTSSDGKNYERVA